MTAPRVVLYERDGCHLCEHAAAELAALARRTPFRLERVDIDADDELQRRFGLEIPVVEVDGQVVAQAPLDIEAVRRALLAATGGAR